MNVQRALQVIPRSARLTAETRPDKYGSAWLVVARMDDGYERVVTQFASTGAFDAAHWLAEYDRLAEADLVERVAIRLYIENKGDLEKFPWPCKAADRYRRVARSVLDEIEISV